MRRRVKVTTRDYPPMVWRHKLMRRCDERVQLRAKLRRALNALEQLHAVVIAQNRAGAEWHPHVFGPLMVALSEAASVLDTTRGNT